MNLEIQSIHFDADKKLLDFIKEKTGRLAQYHEGITRGSVYLRVEKAGGVANKLAELRIHIPGHELFAKKQCKSFEEAVDGSVEALAKQLRKHREKILGE